MSYHFAGHYVKWPFSEATQARLDQEELTPLSSTDQAQYVCVYFEDSAGAKPWDSWLEELSTLAGGAMFLCVQANVGCFLYEHWVNGKLSRGLGYYSDTGWCRVAGDPEPWEAERFFQDRKPLDDYLNDLKNDLEYGIITEADCQAQESELLALWESQSLKEGAFFPFCFEEITVGVVAGYYGVSLFPSQV